jgi:alpha-1,6-mannosyltransferase
MQAPPLVSDPRLAWLRRRPVLTLTALGLASELIYLTYVLLFPLLQYGHAPRPFDMEQIAGQRHWMGAVWLVGLFVLYAAFGLVVAGCEPRRLMRRLIIGFSVLFGFTLIWLYPVTATDLFQYVLRARVEVVHGSNPMAVPPSNFPDDPLLPFAGEWKDIVSPYGPAWELLAAGVARLGFTGAVSGALAYKCVAFVAYLACLWLVDRGVRGRDGRRLLLFAWNPLVLMQGVGNGHNDMVMLAWLLLAIVIWQRRDEGRTSAWPLVVAAVALAVLTKVSAVLMGLLLAVDVLRSQVTWRRRCLVAGGMIGITGTIALLAYLPFWPPWQSIAGVVDEMANRYTYTIAATLRLWLREFLPPQPAWDIPRATGQLLFAGVLAWTLTQLWRRRLDLVSAGFVAYFAYLVAGASYRIWYPLWLVPFAALSLAPSVRWRTVLLCFTSELSLACYYFVWRWYWPDASWLQMHLAIVPWQFGLPLILPILFERQVQRPLGRLWRVSGESE